MIFCYFQVTAFADVHNLTIPEVFVEDGGNYMVKATNKVGEAKCYAKLTVKPIAPQEVMKSVEMRRTTTEITHSPPEFLRLFQDKVVRPGDSVTLDCVIVGSPKPKVGALKLMVESALSFGIKLGGLLINSCFLFMKRKKKFIYLHLLWAFQPRSYIILKSLFEVSVF